MHAAKFSKRGPTKSSAARESPDDYAWRVFLRHVTLLAIVVGHRATPKKRGAVKNKPFPAFISRRDVAQRSAAQLAV